MVLLFALNPNGLFLTQRRKLRFAQLAVQLLYDESTRTLQNLANRTLNKVAVEKSVSESYQSQKYYTSKKKSVKKPTELKPTSIKLKLYFRRNPTRDRLKLEVLV